MTRGKELSLRAMRKEFKRLSTAANKAKSEIEECLNITTEILAIYEEFKAIVDSEEQGQSVIDKLNALKKRRTKADKIFDKDLIKLTEKEAETATARDQLGIEIQRMEFNISLRNGSFGK